MAMRKLLAALFAVLMVSLVHAQGETRIKGAEILNHPITPVALQYVELIHAGRMDDALKLTTSDTQARYRKYPASERTASANFQKKFLPTRAELEASIPTGGLLIIEGDKATLNIVKIEQKSASPGTSTSTSETSAIPFAREGTQWKVAIR